MTEPPAAGSGARPPEGELQRRYAELERELADARRQLAEIRELVIAKLEASKHAWWRRRRALHELEEELVALLKLTPEELTRAGFPAAPAPSFIHRTTQLMQDAAAKAVAWRRKRKRHRPK